ncbi:hypothetical protein BX616_001215 [Lobosporangium transversale]|nr:hypothetical protein BX616_001215 [Lobosporangium transversale]
MTEHQYQQFRKNGIIEKVCVRIASTFASNASSSCYVSLQDIQDVFPDAQRFKLDDLPIPFLIDSNGNRIEPLRIAFYPYKILDVVTEVSRPSNSNSNAVIRLPTLRSSANLAAQEPLLPLSNSIQSFNSLLTTRDNAQIEETNSNLEKVAELLLGAKEKDDKMNNLMAEIREKDDKMSHLLSEIKEKDDKVNNLILEAKEKDIEMLKLRDKMLQLQEKVHNLQDRVLEPQLEAKERGERMQRQDRDRLSLIQNHAHAILAQRFELYDCPIPQLFIILPADCTRWDPINVLKNKVRLHFLCEGTTESPIHIGYEGYEIRNSTRFFQKYGEHIFILLQWLKLRQSSSAGIDCSIEYMETLSRTHLALSNISKIDGYEGLKGSELQELNSFLRINDDSNPAIMHRTTTETVDLKWVCKNHIFRNGQWMLRDAVNKNGGELDSKIGRVIIALKSRDRAKEFFNGLRPVYELDITFGWDWTVTDLEHQMYQSFDLDLDDLKNTSPQSQLQYSSDMRYSFAS